MFVIPHWNTCPTGYCEGRGGVHFREGAVAKFQVVKLVYVMKSLPINFWFSLLDLHIHILSTTVCISLLLLSSNFFF